MQTMHEEQLQLANTHKRSQSMSSLVKEKEESSSDEEYKGKGIKVGKMLGVDESDSSSSSSDYASEASNQASNVEKVSQPLETPKFQLDKPPTIDEEAPEKEEDKEDEIKKVKHARSKSAVEQVEEHLLSQEISELVGSPSQLSKKTKDLQVRLQKMLNGHKHL